MCLKNVNYRLILIYVVLSISVFQAGVDFQLCMFIYYPPNFQCLVSNGSLFVVTPDNCYYHLQNDSSQKYACSKWTFDHSQIHSNIVTDMSLICQKQYMHLLIVPISCLCTMVAIILAYLSDLKGRRIMFIICTFFDTVIWILMGVTSSNYIAHIILRCLKFFGIAASNIGFVLISEIVPERYRNFIMINFWVYYSLGMSFSPLYFKYMLRWNHAWLLASWPMIFYLGAPFILVESPRWLLMNNQKEKALESLKQLGQHPSDDMKIDDTTNDDDVEGMKKFCSSKLLIGRLIALLLTSISINLVYQGTSTNLEFAVHDIYVNSVIMGLIEVPGGIFGYLSSKYVGSVASTTTWILISATTLLCIPDNWVPSMIQTYSGQMSHTVLACFSKFFLIISWSIIAIFYVGLFPTNKRTFTYNLSSMIGYIGAAIGGFLGYYYRENPNVNFKVSNIIYGVILIVFITLFASVIPSVNNVELPNSVHEAEEIKKVYITDYLKKRKMKNKINKEMSSEKSYIQEKEISLL